MQSDPRVDDKVRGSRFSDLKVQSDPRVDDKVRGSRFKVQGSRFSDLRSECGYAISDLKVQSDPRVDDKFFLKNNGLKICTIQENFVPLQHSCKTDIRQRNLRHSQRENFC